MGHWQACNQALVGIFVTIRKSMPLGIIMVVSVPQSTRLVFRRSDKHCHLLQLTSLFILIKFICEPADSRLHIGKVCYFSLNYCYAWHHLFNTSDYLWTTADVAALHNMHAHILVLSLQCANPAHPLFSETSRPGAAHCMACAEALGIGESQRYRCMPPD